MTIFILAQKGKMAFKTPFVTRELSLLRRKNLYKWHKTEISPDNKIIIDFIQCRMTVWSKTSFSLRLFYDLGRDKGPKSSEISHWKKKIGKILENFSNNNLTRSFFTKISSWICQEGLICDFQTEFIFNLTIWNFWFWNNFYFFANFSKRRFDFHLNSRVTERLV